MVDTTNVLTDTTPRNPEGGTAKIHDGDGQGMNSPGATRQGIGCDTEATTTRSTICYNLADDEQDDDTLTLEAGTADTNNTATATGFSGGEPALLADKFDDSRMEEDDNQEAPDTQNHGTCPHPNNGTSTTPTGAKGTTCASTTTNTFGAAGTAPAGTTQEHTTDDTIVKAVGTLHISPHNKSPTAQTEPTLPWTTVTKDPKKATTSTNNNSSHEFGLAFERTTKGNNWSTTDLLHILQTIQAHDPKAMLSSADNKTRPTLVTAILHKAQKDIPWFIKFTAMKTMTWGKPSDGTTKIVFSFWLTSTIIKKDLAQLRMDSDFTEMLKGTNTYMKVTNALR